MTITISCPDCAAQLKARPEWVGRKATCKRCGCQFPIKAFAAGTVPPPLPIEKQWHYAADGQRKGPAGANEIFRLVNSGQITRQTIVWTEGMPEWSPAGQTALSTLFGPAEPPPLIGQHVPNGLAWALAVVPLLDIATVGLLPWYVFVGFNFVLSWIDERRLKKAGHTAPFVGWAFFIPVYLFIRASRTKQRPDYAYVWILCFISSIVAVAAMKAT